MPSHLLMWGLLVPTSMSLLILPVSLDTYKNLTPGFLLLSNYLLHNYKHQVCHEPVVLFCDTLDKHSWWPPPNSGLAQFTVTTMQILMLMTMPWALLHQIMVTEFLLPLWGTYRVCLFSLYISSGFIRGGRVTHNLSSLPGLTS
jgi:hypothetical protein